MIKTAIFSPPWAICLEQMVKIGKLLLTSQEPTMIRTPKAPVMWCSVITSVLRKLRHDYCSPEGESLQMVHGSSLREYISTRASYLFYLSRIRCGISTVRNSFSGSYLPHLAATSCGESVPPIMEVQHVVFRAVKFAHDDQKVNTYFTTKLNLSFTCHDLKWFQIWACCRIIPRLCSSTISNFYIRLELRIPLLTRHLYTFFVHCLAILNGPDWCSSAFSRHGFRGRSRHPPAWMMWFLKQLTNDLSIRCSGAPLPQNARKKTPFPINLRIHLLLFLRGANHHACACEFTYV